MKPALSATIAALFLVAGPFLCQANGRDNSAKSYSVVSLGTLGGKWSNAFAVNSNGQVVGSAQTKDGRRHAFLYENGSMLDLGTLGGKNSEAFALNDSGQIVGDSDVGTVPHAFLYDHGKMYDLGTLGGESSQARGINNSGLIVGHSDVISHDPLAVDSGPPGRHAFAFSGGKMRDLAGIVSTASAVNDSGQIAGSAMFNLNKSNSIYAIRRAALFGKDAIEDFGLPVKNVSVAAAINASGEVVGTANCNPQEAGTGHHYHAFLFDHGTSQDLGTLGGEESRAYAVNRSGQVVGTADTASDGQHAFLFDGDQMQDLNSLATNAALASAGFKVLTTAFGINDHGQIVGVGKNAKGSEIAFLLTPLTAKPWGLPIIQAATLSLDCQ
jgi:probable HAF family extracellular repeat protein